MSLFKFTTYTSSDLEKELGTSAMSGLSEKQVDLLKKQFGANCISTTDRVWLTLLKRQWSSPFMYLLLAASIASFLLESKLNGLLIFSILLVNGFLGFYQEYRASKAVQLLKEQLQRFCLVIREGKTASRSHTELVPGDLIILEQGNYVPADVRIIEGKLTIDESALSGEAYAAAKNSVTLAHEAQDLYGATNIAFAGTMVSSGSARALVLGTGSHTLFGELTMQATQVLQYSSFQERLVSLSRFILGMVVITIPCIFFSHMLIKGSQIDFLELLLFSIALIIGLAPEALPTVMTFALSKGALMLANHNVIVKRLSAIEDLGSITLLCTDKTGTLTENKLTVVSTYAVPEIPFQQYLLLVSPKDSSEPFDKAIWLTSSEQDLRDLVSYTTVAIDPYEPTKKSSSALVQEGSEKILLVRGAYEEIMRRAGITELLPEGKQWLRDQEQKGNRILAVGYKKAAQSLDDALMFGGFVAFSDPIKATAAKAIRRAQDLLVIIKMITGDSKEIAQYVAHTIGLDTRADCAMTGAEFEQLSLEEQKKAVHTYSVFARCLPAQKLRIVELLREEHTVGFLGDGINDAPALKAAHVGIVVQKGSDLAKDAADIILKGKSLNDIVYGIEIGRVICANTLKYLVTSLTSNFGNFYSIALASLFIDFLPLLPRQILLNNMLTDFPMIAIATDTVDEETLKHPPKFSVHDLALRATLLGGVSSLFDFMFFRLFYYAQPAVLQTGWFIESALSELILIFSLRTRRPWFKAHRPSALLIGLSAIVGCICVALPFSYIGNLFFSFARLSSSEMATIAVLLVGYSIVTDTVKVIYMRYFQVSHSSNLQKII